MGDFQRLRRALNKHSQGRVELNRFSIGGVEIMVDQMSYQNMRRCPPTKGVWMRLKILIDSRVASMPATPGKSKRLSNTVTPSICSSCFEPFKIASKCCNSHGIGLRFAVWITGNLA